MPDASPSYLESPVQTRAADVRPGSWDEAARTVEVIASTGAMVRRYGFMSEYDEEIPVTEQVFDLVAGELQFGGPGLVEEAADGSPNPGAATKGEQHGVLDRGTEALRHRMGRGPQVDGVEHEAPVGHAADLEHSPEGEGIGEVVERLPVRLGLGIGIGNAIGRCRLAVGVELALGGGPGRRVLGAGGGDAAGPSDDVAGEETVEKLRAE